MTDTDDKSYEGAFHSQGALDGPKMGVTIGPVIETPQQRISTGSLPAPRLYTNKFFSRSATLTAARKQYLKILTGGMVLASLVIFGVFPILWGAFYRTPVQNFPGWIIVRTLYCRFLTYLTFITRILMVASSAKPSRQG